MKKIVYILILFFTLIPSVKAEENLVNIYLFHSENCNHCKSEIELLNELEKEYSNIRVYKYEVNEGDNNFLFGSVTNLLDARTGGVPFTVIGGKYYNGFSKENGKKIFVATIEYYSKYGYKDVVGEYIGNIELPSYEIEDNVISLSEYVKNYGNYELDFPFGIDVVVNDDDFDLSTNIVLISLMNIFSFSSLLILLVLIFLIINVKDKKKLFIFGLTFLVSYLCCYLVSMFLFPNMLNYFNNKLIKMFLVIIIIIFGLCKSMMMKEKKCNKDNDIIIDKKFIFSIIFIIILSILISVGSSDNRQLVLVFNNLLYLNDVSVFMKIIYIIIYNLIYFVIYLLLFIILVLFFNRLNLCKRKVI